MKRLLFVLFVSCVLLGCSKDTETVIKYRDNYTEVVKNESDRVVISDVVWEWKESLGSGYLTTSGKVKNSGTVNLDYVKIFVKSYDVDNKLISEDYGYVANTKLTPGSESTWAVDDFNCKSRPTKVTVGYSYSAEITVPAPKGVLN